MLLTKLEIESNVNKTRIIVTNFKLNFKAPPEDIKQGKKKSEKTSSTSVSKTNLTISKLFAKKLEQNKSGFSRIQTFKEKIDKNNTLGSTDQPGHKPSYLTNISESNFLSLHCSITNMLNL